MTLRTRRENQLETICVKSHLLRTDEKPTTSALKWMLISDGGVGGF